MAIAMMMVATVRREAMPQAIITSRGMIARAKARSMKGPLITITTSSISARAN